MLLTLIFSEIVVEEDMDTIVEDDNSYEVIPEVHEPPKHEGKTSGTVQFKTSFKANKVVVHPLILRVSSGVDILQIKSLKMPQEVQILPLPNFQNFQN